MVGCFIKLCWKLLVLRKKKNIFVLMYFSLLLLEKWSPFSNLLNYY